MKNFFLLVLFIVSSPVSVLAKNSCLYKLHKYKGDIKETYSFTAEVAYSKSHRFDEAIFEECKNAKYEGPLNYPKLLCNGQPVYDFVFHPYAPERYYAIDRLGKYWNVDESNVLRERVLTKKCKQISETLYIRETKDNVRIYIREAGIYLLVKDHKKYFYKIDPTKIRFKKPNFY